MSFCAVIIHRSDQGGNQPLYICTPKNIPRVFDTEEFARKVAGVLAPQDKIMVEPFERVKGLNPNVKFGEVEHEFPEEAKGTAVQCNS